MANNRGTKYSKNLRVSDKASEAYWDFDFTDMGMHDVPAFFHTQSALSYWMPPPATEYWIPPPQPIAAESPLSPGRYPMHYIGYDMGNTQFFYALTQLGDTVLD
mmetsp:Transcript_1005/g.1373  ORF Transcript_1005/g.1373 Transcript_1005/m.1373 type:complete len:104 (-) Transcript_1005:734-1045(-)|eukprot:CAMPEP_0185583962 /NCGR_PEP_ID=MMETSP0434-20130131/29282_1 /TAXON_ID=626734 ORGANISM="Favella taraikaensis, Strain Fe Narragansett Bay" /NCGR_SAMPLE_ID=MMETSP0434 /ASSEMBLY_ACC=CAM_ASM_000379 /LENGTH=103 /DNA_ID=CAMNT_0028203423 /DNA_START=282 /DNA_END=593 /DNA_ORIENTATION=+